MTKLPGTPPASVKIVDGISRAAVKARGAGIVVADPEGAAGTSGRGGRTSEPPGILQVRVHDRRHALNVRDEVRLFVMLRLRYSREQKKRKSENGQRLPCGKHLRILPKRDFRREARCMP